MLDELHVENLALIRDAVLVPGTGLTVLTGETGAGKTALLSALKLLMGERADVSMVREGERSASVEGRLFLNPHDIEGVSVCRRIGSDGRSRVRLDGEISSVRALTQRVASHIDLCGQHEHQRLLDAATHVEMVDAWASREIEPLRSAYVAALEQARSARCELDRIEAAIRTRGSRLDEARFTLERINEVDPGADELETLEESLPRIEHAETLAGCAHQAQAMLSDEQGALDGLNSAIAELERMRQVDPTLGTHADALAEAAITLEDVSSDLRRYRDEIEFDPRELERSQARFSELKGLLRRFGPRMSDVLARRDEALELIGLVDDGAAQIARARETRDQAEASLTAAARSLMRRRAELAPRFCREVAKQMARLEMGSSELVWETRELPRERWTKSGPAACELLYRTGPGLTPRPLRKIASGGELSRVLLACKVVLGDANKAGTFVFDEVDAGVGGAVARSLAQVLADLARTHQVIVVTHVAQVAVLAEVHYVVERQGTDEPVTVLTQVTGETRVREIARMLSGDATDASLSHARQMLHDAQRSQGSPSAC
ncbi:DNA replication and repair protein RecN [Coriobacterium glomerans PW2]|uniref:DNA repair protein RecN n=1 Tax=Coriobacterium glomerans (strain ATCC 49209 / DSM 20642 / JCM 10262 / PW2) TaxID=700015 RepID=F2N7Y8_CORGP|nr:DNA repair protein RecN [Coriobacterium glomerans]AEB07097.1 DNA replication and repair protein RecN [Coriobacterium glomerans PW2]